MEFVDNLIIGAGPAGLQLGYFFEASGRDYLILETQEEVGSFFRTYPRHRTLLSLNKRFNYYSSPNFNLRHDWNSLLSGTGGPRFTNFSEALYPDADELVEYLLAFTKTHRLRVSTLSRARRIQKCDPNGFVVELDHKEIRASRIFVATGATRMQTPPIPGIELAKSYSDHDLDPRAYRNSRVAIIGRGNSAFEVANHLAPEAALVHLLVAKPVKHAWNTHYPGDLRAVNNSVLDLYQLKSLHGTFAYDVQRIQRAASGALAVDIEELLPHWDPPAIQSRTIEYDHVIYCTGWQFAEPELFDEDIRPKVSENKKYFTLSPWWETSTPGVFCIGTAMQQRDRTAASSFIHGFRYNIRTLHRRIEESVYSRRYPRAHASVAGEQELVKLADVVLKRLSTTSALYQQFGVLCDVLLPVTGGVDLTPELPTAFVQSAEFLKQHSLFMTIALQYGFDRYGPSVAPLEFIRPFDPAHPECSAFLHPVIRIYRGGELATEMHMGESFDLRWDAEAVHDTWEVGHRSIVMSALNELLRVTSKQYDRKYEAMRSRLSLRPMHTSETTENNHEQAAYPCVFRQ